MGSLLTGGGGFFFFFDGGWDLPLTLLTSARHISATNMAGSSMMILLSVRIWRRPRISSLKVGCLKTAMGVPSSRRTSAGSTMQNTAITMALSRRRSEDFNWRRGVGRNYSPMITRKITHTAVETPATSFLSLFTPKAMSAPTVLPADVKTHCQVMTF